MSGDEIKITSINQQGGITAHTVNVGAQQRSLANMPKLKASLLSDLPRNRPINVEYSMGDAEAGNLAAELYEFLKANGFRLAYPALSQAVYQIPQKGVSVVPETDPLRLIVGSA